VFSFHVFHISRGEPEFRIVRIVEFRRRQRHGIRRT
jgi:hypothetical protein